MYGNKRLLYDCEFFIVCYRKLNNFLLNFWWRDCFRYYDFVCNIVIGRVWCNKVICKGWVYSNNVIIGWSVIRLMVGFSVVV